MLVFFLVLLTVAVADLASMVWMGGIIGILPTVLLVIALCVAGVWLTKVEGLGVLRRMRIQLAAGETPTDEVVNGVLILAGGLLMIVPGFVTAALGLLLLLPPVRSLLRPFVLRRARRRIERGRSRFAVFTSGPSGSWGPVGNAPFDGPVYDVDPQPRGELDP